ncbi:zinc finger protein 385A-like [Uloborus diversus]|uniref:zinc finger protein 385A-like n=1 Tax=Uloborus diversus TaxID=327109 RepID=UPI00240A68BD|nr:zinc finger protein 385A-like [Uloborus diversus]
MDSNKKQWHCAVCSIDFTSQIPLDMHLRGAKHAKKLKSRDIMNAINNPAPAKGNDPVPQAKELYCALCNVQTNSSLQLQTHLDGSKHKNKLKGDTPKDEAEAKTVEITETKPKTQVNGNGSITRTLPSDFDEPQPSKLMKFSCDICNICMNSSIQLSQHLASKKHQAKVEGKPLLKGKKAKEATQNELPKEESESNQASEPMDTSSKDLKTVIGVQALSSSFVQSGTLL